MRHNKSINHLGRTSEHRDAMLSNMACSLITYKRISTTLAKAKALREFIEPIITRSKDASMHNRRIAFSSLKNKEAVHELFKEVGPKVATRPGGYTRILKTGYRPGDNAHICVIELVDFNLSMLTKKEEAKGKAVRRTRRGASKKTESTNTKEASAK